LITTTREIEEKTPEHLLWNKKGCGHYLAKVKDRSVDNLGQTTCHSGIRTASKITDVTTCYNMEVDGAPELWEYLTSPEGPFRDIFSFCPDGWILLTRENKVFAVKIPDKIFEFDPYPLVYSFLICTRMPDEYQDYLKVFKKFINMGIDKNKAFLLMPFFSVSDAGELKTRASTWDGSHKCLSEREGLVIDTNLWCSGQYKTKGIARSTLTSSLWSMSGQRYMRNFVFDAYGTITIARFGGTFTVIKEDKVKEMISDFDKFLKSRYK
jgi:hypothetical protein